MKAPPSRGPDGGHECRQAREGLTCTSRSPSGGGSWVGGPAHPTGAGRLDAWMLRYAGGCNGGGTLPLPRLCCSTTHILRSSVTMPPRPALRYVTVESGRRSLRTGEVIRNAWRFAPRFTCEQNKPGNTRSDYQERPGSNHCLKLCFRGCRPGCDIRHSRELRDLREAITATDKTRPYYPKAAGPG